MRVLALFFMFIIKVQATLPDFMLLENYKNQDVSGWVMSEKLDGIGGYWDGKQLFTRQNKVIQPPHYFVRDFPPFAIDGELFTERNQFEKISSIVRSKKDKVGKKMRKLYVFLMFPMHKEIYLKDWLFYKIILINIPPPYIKIIEQIPLKLNNK